jgi:hypothetical protein
VVTASRTAADEVAGEEAAISCTAADEVAAEEAAAAEALSG